MFAPPMPKEKTPWWLWPSLLSFDAPLVALAWLYMFAGAWQVRYLTWAAYVTLALGVWVVYVADRLLEYRLRGDGDAEMGVRHRFHARHRKKFLAGVGLASAVILPLVFGFLPSELLLSYAVPAIAMVTAFFAMVAVAPRNGEIPYVRNLVAGLAFGYGTAMMAHIRVPSQEMVAMLTSREMLSFAVLCALNITAIHLWEHSRRSDDREIKAADELTLSLPLTGLAAVGLIFASMDNPWMFGRGGGDEAARPFFYAVLVSAALLQVINRVRERFSLDALRTLADLAMIAPLPLFVLWVGF